MRLEELVFSSRSLAIKLAENDSSTQTGLHCLQKQRYLEQKNDMVLLLQSCQTAFFIRSSAALMFVGNILELRLEFKSRTKSLYGVASEMYGRAQISAMP